ncbi:hypothetical protein FIBSPDRAFT_869432 [Athelia psychrophila]|uniref:Uncharacterized protein n=1 Tax=Athelia psychrophila TaxID=1759441 RepID=A0A166C4J7_9AGAM|nr:hypothetical protein FIBSPDRAFT_869432 [Fibularhizoctonia sp. CBS 109695]
MAFCTGLAVLARQGRALLLAQRSASSSRSTRSAIPASSSPTSPSSNRADPAGRAYLGPRRHRGGALLEPARNGIVATQVEEDESASSIIQPLTAIAVGFCPATT